MEDRVKKVMAGIFGIDEASINSDSSVNNVETWDSLAHMQLVLALEKEFGIEIEGEKLTEIISYQLIVETIKKMIN